MRSRSIGFAVAMALLAGVVVGQQGGVAWGATPTKALPEWADVKEALATYFKSVPGHQPGDLIVRSEAEQVMGQLLKLGWQVADAREILAQVPSDKEFLAVTLRSPAGRKFMRSISGYPDGYDRLDRLARLPRGQRMVRDLVRGPGGYKMIEYMTTAPGGRALGQQLSRAPKGANFNKATRRIYTARMLEDRLKVSYEKFVNGSAIRN